MNTAIDLNAELDALQDDYTYRINLLLDEGREDLATELSQRYITDAARVLARAEAAALN